MNITDITEFYSDRGGGVRSHLTRKGHVLCQLGHHQITIAPGRYDSVSDLDCGTERVSDPLKGSLRAGATHRVIRVAGPSLPYDASYHLLHRVDKVLGHLAHQKSDVLEVHSPYLAAFAGLMAGSRLFRVRTFFWHADFIDTYLRVLAERWLGARSTDALLAPLWEYVRALTSRCDATFVAGKWQFEKLTNRGVPRLIHLPFGVDKSLFHPERRSEERRRELLRSTRSPLPALLIGVGRLAVEKHWEVVLRAFFRLRGTGLDARLVLFGDGPERARLEHLAADRTDVSFMGSEPDPNRLAAALASADALVHACPFETFGLCIAEAQSAGVPVVVPDRGGAQECVSGASAEIYASDDPAACALAIERLLRRDPSLLRAAADQARKRVLSVEHHFATALGYYAELLERATSEPQFSKRWQLSRSQA